MRSTSRRIPRRLIALGLAPLLALALLWGPALAQYVLPPAQATLTVDNATPAPGSEVECTCTVIDDQGNPVANQDVLFRIVSQPGTDASIGSTEVTKTTDDQGVARATLSVGSTPGEIVMECVADQAVSQVTIQVVSEVAALPATGTGTEAGGSVPWQPALLVLLGAALIGLTTWRVRRHGFKAG